jgi:hypothetical protein
LRASLSTCYSHGVETLAPPQFLIHQPKAAAKAAEIEAANVAKAKAAAAEAAKAAAKAKAAAAKAEAEHRRQTLGLKNTTTDAQCEAAEVSRPLLLTI